LAIAPSVAASSNAPDANDVTSASAGIILIVRIPGLRLLCLFERCRNVVRHIDRHTGDTFSKAITLAVSSMCLLFLN
jgi:hypothetical protein